MNKLPKNFLSRYNRLVGVSHLTENKLIMWSNYTYAILDLTIDLPAEVQIVQDHPYRTIQGKHRESDGWFDMVKLGQQKYLTDAQHAQSSVFTQSVDNLTISNKLKGILQMEVKRDENKIRVVENVWKKAVGEFQGAFISKKFNQ
jgi:hypothetical protein